MALTTCFSCGGSLDVIRNEPYRYTECGFDNIYLVGIHQYRCKACNENYVSVPRVDALHRVIGKDLCCKKPSLFNPKEIKFLRKELHLKSKELARALGVAPETVSRWENNKSPISESKDRLFRTLYMMFVSEQADEVLHHDVLKLFSGLPRGRKKATRTKKIELSPVDWMDKHQPQFCSA